MGFVHYRVVLKLISPLHIGRRKYRNLMEPREYVPGRTLWGALTARIVRDYFKGETGKYERVGDLLNKNFRLGYLWPSLDGENSYFPWEHKDFDYLFKSGYMGQSIDYTRGATEEGYLHEIEFIPPKTRDGRQVYLIGDLWVSNKNGFIESKDPLKVKIEDKTIDMAEVLSSLQLGGERSYGWGRVKCKHLRTHSGHALGSIKIESANSEVILEFSENSHLTAHALAAPWKGENSIPENCFQGEIEPLTGYSWKKSDEKSSEKQGWHLSLPPICFIPGSLVKEKLKVKIGKFGIFTSK